MSLWNLSNGEGSYVMNPKFADKGHAFSPNHKYYALIERNDCKDQLSIFSTQDWTLLKHFPMESSDAEGLAWSLDSECVAIWDHSLEVIIIID
jgi:hypothetical protein